MKSQFVAHGGAGASVDKLGRAPKEGFMVSAHKDREQIIKTDLSDRGNLAKLFRAYAEKNKDLVNEPNTYLGAWADKGKLYLDVPVKMKDQARALAACKKVGDLAIYDVKGGQAISL